MAVLTYCLTDLLLSKAPAQVRLFEGYLLARRVLATSKDALGSAVRLSHRTKRDP